ncbi:hypothetical protein SUGI_0415480 [Cryptomeria japonica]|nr:hypothetical protein SUGI_0415480 [Cryptomeria japonica]
MASPLPWGAMVPHAIAFPYGGCVAAADGSNGRVADDQYHRYKEKLLMRAMAHKAVDFVGFVQSNRLYMACNWTAMML